jgi:DNA polymerase-3 subunit alpha
VIDIAKRLEGLCRNAGMHAAGVIIADQPLDNVVPLYRDSDGNILTQFEGPIAEKCGLLKMDFLGLRTLTVLQRSIDLVKQTKGIEIDIEKIDFADRKVLDLFCRGETKGIFQFESGGMQDLLMKMQPDRLEDLIAANALYRPGPMELIPIYCNRKHGRERVPGVHPIMDDILKETYGIMVYQEQVMQIFNQLGGIELSSAYKLIKAISKKTVDVIAKYHPDFIKGAMAKGISKSQAQEIFDLILKFGGYGFNKSHSTRYAIIAFQTAYMKTYHPVEYMAAQLTFEIGSTDKMVEYIEECRRMTVLDGTRGIQVLPPDVNASDRDFTPLYVQRPGGRDKGNGREKNGVIRFGLCAVRGVGEKAVDAIIQERRKAGDYRSLYDFTERVDLRQVQRNTIEALVKCGAFSSVSEKRAPLLHVLERAVEMGQQAQVDKRNGQLAMFGSTTSSPTTSSRIDSLPDVQELPGAELLKFEKELLGFYITSHPLTAHQTALERYSTATTREALAMAEGADVTIGGMIGAVRARVAKSGRSAGQKWAIITLEDLEGSIEGMVFAELYAALVARNAELLTSGSICFVKAKVDRKRETPCLVINEIFSIAEAVPKLTTTVAIKLDPLRHDAGALREIKPLLARHKGNLPVFAQVKELSGRKVTMKLPKDLNVRPTTALVDDIDLKLGHGTLQLYGDGQRRLRRIQQQVLFREADQASEEAPISEEQVATPDQEVIEST